MATLLKWEDRGVRRLVGAHGFSECWVEIATEQAQGLVSFDRRQLARLDRKLRRAISRRLFANPPYAWKDNDPFPEHDD